MADSIELEVATPERLLVREQVTEVQVPGKDGYLGILPGHAPLLSRTGHGLPELRRAAASALSLRCTAASWKCCRTTCACWPTPPSAPKRSTWSAPGDDLKRAQEQVINPALGVDPAAALDAMAAAQARIDAAEKK